MKRLLTMFIAALALALSVHSLAMAAAPMMPHAAEMAMDHSAQSMPSDCLTYCLSNLEHMAVTGIPTQAPQLLVVFAILLSLAYIVLQIRIPRYNLTQFRPKPPDILALTSAYLI